MWFSSRVEDLYILSKQPEIIRLFRVLSSLQPVPENLIESIVQKELGQIFAPLLESEDFEGLVLLDNDGFVLASSMKKEIGAMAGSNFPSGFFNEIFSGTRPVVIELPRKITGTDKDENFLKTSVLFGTLVFDEEDTPLGALVLYTDPKKDFSGILQRGRLGDSGESYAFNRTGQLVSESRFDIQLHEIIQLVLGQDSSDGDSDDGLELGICYIPVDGKKLTYAGARFSIFYQDSDGKVNAIIQFLNYKGCRLLIDQASATGSCSRAYMDVFTRPDESMTCILSLKYAE